MAIVQSDGSLVTSSRSFLANQLGGGYRTGVSWYDGITEDYASIYRTQPNVRLVVDFFARNIGSIAIKPFERIDDTRRESLGDHEIGELLRSPNEALSLTAFEFMYTLISDLKTFDEFFVLRQRNEVNGKLRLFRLGPNEMQPVEANPWRVTKWRWLGVPGQPEIDAANIIHYGGYNPENMKRGLSPIESLRQILSEDRAAGQYRQQYWNSGARISGVIERPNSMQGTPNWSPEARDRFKTSFDAEYGGAAPGAGGTPLLEDGMTFKQISFSAKDSEYISARRLSREEVAAQYHLSPLFVGILENANFSNVKEQHRHLYQDAFGPDLVLVAQVLRMGLVPEYADLINRNVYLEFDFKDKLKGSFEEEAAAQQASVGGPWRSRNEARADDNLPPIEGGDELITPLNVLIGGQASPQDSAPGTASFPYYVALDQFTKAHQTAPKKSADELPDDVKTWFDQHVEMLQGTFGRQENAVVAALGGGSSIETVWDDARWNSELKADFLDLATSMTSELGQKIADQFDGTFDADIAANFLDENSRSAAEGVNYTTKQQIANLDSDGDGFLDSVRNVFAVAAASRASQIATTRVTDVGGFAKKEGAEQGGAGFKIWNVLSSNSRHPGMNGQKVAIGETFSNGARWPADHLLAADERDGCVCGITFER